MTKTYRPLGEDGCGTGASIHRAQTRRTPSTRYDQALGKLPDKLTFDGGLARDSSVPS